MTYSQTDIVYLMDGDSVVDCTIKEVANGDWVWYVKGETDFRIRSTGIIRGGLYLSLPLPTINEEETNGVYPYLYQGRGYTYYHKRYRQGILYRNTGRVLTFSGFGLAGMGLYMILFGHDQHNGEQVYMAGTLVGNLGIGLWVGGGMRTANSRIAIEKCKTEVKLSFGVHKHGVGFVLAVR